ncbi:MAG: allophanate hydrolase [Parvibaculaceae bacterium]|nr:allophanate hydrolase [Parvibaculaceae bacterium]
MKKIDLQIGTLKKSYLDGTVTPTDVINEVYDRIEACPDKAVWISLISREAALKVAKSLGAPNADMPLFGVPFAVKDNIDCADTETTAGCPSFAYQPSEDATIVARLRSAGAILIGKTNLDQFATGLVGVRSPYDAPRSVFNDEYISGGSSSGSAVAVARGLVSFSLGTDTAGSGRVPAAFNNIVGWKPTRGLLSTKGVVPACRSLDCVSIFAASCGDATLIKQVAAGLDLQNSYSRASESRPLLGAAFSFGVLNSDSRVFFGDTGTERLYDQSIEAMRALGGTPVEIDYAPFAEMAELLYTGPWVAERYAAVGDHVAQGHGDIDPSVLHIVKHANGQSAVDAFKGQYRLSELRRTIDSTWQEMDVFLLPTTSTTYKVEEVAADPITLNSQLGTYTNFVNLADCAAVALPAGFANGLPRGVTLIGPAFTDDGLLALGDQLHRQLEPSPRVGATDTPLLPAAPLSTGDIRLSVVGAHLTGQPLNRQLTELNAKLEMSTTTSADYRLYALSNTTPAKPGLVRSHDGTNIPVEVWLLDDAAFGRFCAMVPTPLGIGNVELADGSWVKGFICEQIAIDDATDITAHGGWKAYLSSK